jgi:hypothetical protein
LIVQPGASIGRSKMVDMSEAYYVISGEGSVTVDNETAAIKVGDAIPVDLGHSKSFTAGTAPLELMVVGIARDIRTKNAFAAVAAKQKAGLVMLGVGGAEPPCNAAPFAPGRRQAAIARRACFLCSFRWSMLR